MKMRSFSSVSSVIRYEYYSNNVSDERRDYLMDNWNETNIKKIVKIDNKGTSREGIRWYTFWLSSGEYGIYYDRSRL